MQQNNRRRLILPKIEDGKNSDIRLDYESGMSVVLLAEKYCYDPRTIRRALYYNLSSNEIGKQLKPKKTDCFKTQIKKYWDELEKHESMLAASRNITERLRKLGYDGSERTIRNYLLRQPYVKEQLEGEDDNC